MKKTAHGNPIHFSKGKTNALERVHEFSEKQIQDLIFDHPECLPISDIDESYNPVIPICTELWTPAGPLDILMVTPNGDLVIIETKLWYNPEARRKVIAQILDYAKEFSKWSYSDLQREINKRNKSKGNVLYDLAAKHQPDNVLSEIDFVDAVNRNLRIGKILLLIAGDGIREGAKEISEFLNNSASLNFTLAMVEMPIYRVNESEIILFPRTTLKTTEIQKINIEIPEGFKLTQDAMEEVVETNEKGVSEETLKRRKFFSSFWGEFIEQLNFDDPGQVIPDISRTQNLYIYPGTNKSTWISCYFSKGTSRVGVYYRFQNNQKGQVIKESLTPYLDDIKEELGEKVNWQWDDSLPSAFSIILPLTDIYAKKNRKKIIDFFSEWTNKFVNTIRPRLKQIE
ncbi:MAG: DUF4268 domain-containing protein [Winogradskyella sp.]|uniref:DUF4268 domain-containing protein n=1 Tax=Winogradskyella sp. TaxID=1883156 RepID=UPI001821FB62|nr:DUF4268 domain-containing protein [Winogradskyella sp.]